MKVVLNVDDYCFCKSQIDGTIFAYQNGVVSSTTCMANMSDELLEYGVAKAKENPGLAIGCHLNLTYGCPVTKNKTLTAEDGHFFKSSVINYESLDQEEIYNEFKAQIERFIKFFGKKPTHLDSHHRGYPIMSTNNIRYIVERLEQEYGLPRGRRSSRDVIFVGELYNEFTIENFKKVLLESMDRGLDCIEQACHAAFVDKELFENTSYTYQRVMELKVVTSEEIKQFYKEHNIERAHY